MKKLFFLIFFSIFIFTTSTTRANCDIATVAQRDLNDVYRYINLGFTKPSLFITSTPLIKADKNLAKEYGKLKNSRGFVASYLDYDQNKIVIYRHVFDGHAACDDFVTQKIRKYVVHEYTHYLDQNSQLSDIAHTTNPETTAIIGENILPKMVWGKRNPMVLRELARKEKEKAKRVQRFIFRSRKAI